MRVRVRGPAGQSTITLDNATATIGELRYQIAEKTGLLNFGVKYGYPNLKPLELDRFDSGQPIADMGVNLNGEQLVISNRESAESKQSSTTSGSNSTFQQAPQKTVWSSRKGREPDAKDPPEIPSVSHSGTFVLRIMPDDNSCLFRAVGTAIMGGMDTMNELRHIVAQVIQENQGVYSEAILDKKPSDYCRWIQNENSWGGAIELNILSKYFDIEVCSIDVQTLRVDRFNEGASTQCILVYSGIHYDTIALSPSDPPYTHTDVPPEFDTKVFDAADDVALERSVELCRILQAEHYYTDTAGFRIRCNTCGGTFVGEKGAAKHASQTGHYDFGES